MQGAGEEVEVAVTHLQMTAPPGYPWPAAPAGPPAALVVAEAPPPWYFLALYDAVGADYDWTDQHARPRGELAAFLAHPEVTLHVLICRGWPHGFFLLDGRAPAATDLAYFGLVPEAVGRGLGRFLLETAVHTAWARPGLRRLTVNTNSLDHPRALPLYQRAGFTPYRRETTRRRPGRASLAP